MGGPKKNRWVWCKQSACDDLNCLLGGGVLGDGLGTLRHSVLGQLTGQQKPTAPSSERGCNLPVDCLSYAAGACPRWDGHRNQAARLLASLDVVGKKHTTHHKRALRLHKSL